MMEAYTHICIIISREEGYGEASVPFMQRDDTVGGGDMFPRLPQCGDETCK